MASTLIGKSIVVDGEITGEEDLVIQGTVKGKISTKANVTVEDSGVVEADVEGASVTVGGQVTGSVSAQDRLELTSEGRLVGDIKAPRIMFADGAAFKGNVEMDI